MVKARSWIDEAAKILAHKHCLQEDYITNWIKVNHITTDQVERFFKMDSPMFLETMKMWL